MPNPIADRVAMLVQGAHACTAAADSGVEAIAGDMDADGYRALSFKLWDQALRLSSDQPNCIIVE